MMFLELNPFGFVYLSVILLTLPLLYLVIRFVSPKEFGLKPRQIAKTSAYECGYTPFSLRRKQIDVKFLLVGLLFLIFDIEILILVPMLLGIFSFSWIELGLVFLFLTGLGLGLVWEISAKALKFT